MFWNISSIIPLIAFAAYSILLSIAIWRGPGTNPARIFILYLFSMVIWSLGSFLMHLDPPFRTPLFWNRFMLIGVFAMPILFYSFVRSFLGIRKQKIWLYLGTVLYLSLLTANVMGHIVKEAYVLEGVFYYEIGIAAYFVFMSCILFVGLAAFNLVQKYKETKDSDYRNRLKYLLIGILIIAAGTATNFTKLGRYPLDILINTINALLITYVIPKYKLLDINIVIRKGSVYFALTIIIASVYLMMIFVLERLLRGMVEISLVAILIAIGIALIFQPLRGRLQRWIDRLFFRERFDYYQALRRFAQRMVAILDLDELVNSTMNIVSETMQTGKVSIFLINKDEFYLKGHMGLGESNVSRLKLKKDNPLVIWLDKNGKILAKDEIGIFPELKSLWEREIRDLEMLEAELFIPLKFKNDLVGIIILGRKLSESEYFQDDRALLSSMADQAAVAFENARLYEEIRQSLKEKEKLEKKLRQQHEQLVRTERLRALGEMAGGVAHDFNNLLTAILGNVQLLSMRIGKVDAEEIKDKLRIIETSTLDGAKIVKRIQEFSRVRTDKAFVQVDIEKIIRDAIEITKPSWRDEAQKKGGTIEVITRLNKLPPVVGDSSELREVLTNIIFNAVDAMPEGGRITISTKEDEDKVYTSISDTGVGMSERTKRKVFDPFFTTKRPRSSGLGMSLSYGIITRYGGDIEIDTEKGKGTTFTIKLPISPEIEEKKRRTTSSSETRKANILVIDDEKGICDILKEMLSLEGHSVASSLSAKKGIELFRKKEFDLVLTDLGMPEISGWELAKRIKDINPQVLVAMITGWGKQVDRKEMKKWGIDFSLAKPFQQRELFDLVAKATEAKEKY
ncbi:response regulator [Candidatus Aerophobetes bacterium]|nr:response regulator [Candidatus Aerophobetes bacterium]